MSAPIDRRVLLVGYYGVDNLGDEAIRQAIEAAAAYVGVSVAYYVSRRPDADPHAVGSGFRALPRLARVMREVDGVVLGGGGILKDEGLRLPLELLATAVLARALRRPVTLLGVGVGPIYTRLGSWLVQLTARLARVRAVRDVASADVLRSMGVRHVFIGADPIFTTPPPEPIAPSVRGERAAVDPTGHATPDAARLALVSLRPWFHKLPDQEAARRSELLADGVAAAIRQLVDAGWQATMVALYWPRDRDAADAVVARVDRAAVASPSSPLDWDGLVAAAGASSLVIAMRYHALAAAAIAGTPVVALAYEPKVRSLAEDLGVVCLDVDAKDLAADLDRLVAEAAEGRLPPAAEALALDELRKRAWGAVRAAMLVPR